MEILQFIRFSLKRRYFMRWALPALFIYIPGLNLFSLGYLSKLSKILLIGDLGLPVWEDKKEVWFEGLYLIFILILYEAIPFFLFFSGFFFSSLGSWLSFFGEVILKISYVAIFLFSLFLPFAFATYAETHDLKRAFEFKIIYRGIKEVFSAYIVGYLLTFLLLYFCKKMIRIPFFFGFFLSSLSTYYVLLLSTYYFTQIYKRTTLTEELAAKGEL